MESMTWGEILDDAVYLLTNAFWEGMIQTFSFHYE